MSLFLMLCNLLTNVLFVIQLASNLMVTTSSNDPHYVHQSMAIYACIYLVAFITAMLVLIQQTWHKHVILSQFSVWTLPYDILQSNPIFAYAFPPNYTNNTPYAYLCFYLQSLIPIALITFISFLCFPLIVLLSSLMHINLNAQTLRLLMIPFIIPQNILHLLRFVDASNDELLICISITLLWCSTLLLSLIHPYYDYNLYYPFNALCCKGLWSACMMEIVLAFFYGFVYHQNIFWMLPTVFIILGMPLSLPIMFFVYQSTSNMLSSSMFSKAQLFREWIIESITNESILYDKIYVYLRVHHRPPAPQAVCNESQPFLIDLNLTKTQEKSSNTLEYLRWNMRRKKEYLFQYHESIYARLLSFHHMDAFMLMWNQRLCAVLYVLYALGRMYVMICAPMAWILNRAMNQRNDAEYYSWMDIFITFLLCIYVYFLYLFGSSGAVLLRFEYWFGFFCHKDSRMKTNGCKEMYQQMQRNRVLLNSFFPIDVVRIISQFAG
eukprot:277045_1